MVREASVGVLWVCDDIQHIPKHDPVTSVQYLFATDKHLRYLRGEDGEIQTDYEAS